MESTENSKHQQENSQPSEKRSNQNALLPRKRSKCSSSSNSGSSQNTDENHPIRNENSQIDENVLRLLTGNCINAVAREPQTSGLKTSAFQNCNKENAREISNFFKATKSVPNNANKESTAVGIRQGNSCANFIVEINPERTRMSAEQKLLDAIDRISRDKNLLPDNSPLIFRNLVAGNRESIITEVESVLVQMQQTKQIEIRDRVWENCVFFNNRVILKPIGSARNVITKSDRSQSRNKYELLETLLKKIKYFLQENAESTKRELYYQNVTWIKNQDLVNEAIDCISCILNVGAWEFGVFATSKGLIYGNVRIHTADNEIISCNNPGGTLIPRHVKAIRRIEADAHFILVVEKDSMFQKLLDEDIPNKLARPFIMITGKGYPDTNTRLFLRKLWTSLSIPVFMLVDADPHGIEIMLVYRFGSVCQAHLSEHLAVPSLRWIGIFPSEITTLNITRRALTEKERGKARDILKRPYVEAFPRIKEELETLLQKGVKAEIEGVMKNDTYMSEVYLPNKLYIRDYI